MDTIDIEQTGYVDHLLECLEDTYECNQKQALQLLKLIPTSSLKTAMVTTNLSEQSSLEWDSELFLLFYSGTNWLSSSHLRALKAVPTAHNESFFLGIWLSYLMDLLSLRLFGVVGAKNCVRNSFSQ